MNFGSGSSSNCCRCSVAEGVSVMAAFRGRSLEGLFGLSVVEGEEDGGLVTGFDFCASVSVMLMLCLSGLFKSKELYCPVCWGGLVLLNSEEVPAIDVSGMSALRGGGGVGSRERGWYSVIVESCLLVRCFA